MRASNAALATPIPYSRSFRVGALFHLHGRNAVCITNRPKILALPTHCIEVVFCKFGISFFVMRMLTCLNVHFNL